MFGFTHVKNADLIWNDDGSLCVSFGEDVGWAADRAEGRCSFF